MERSCQLNLNYGGDIDIAKNAFTLSYNYGFKALSRAACREDRKCSARAGELRRCGDERADVVTSSRGRCPLDACATPLYRLTVARKLILASHSRRSTTFLALLLYSNSNP